METAHFFYHVGRDRRDLLAKIQYNKQTMLHIGRNIITLLISKILGAAIIFLVYTRLIQYLGPESAGQYGLLAAYLTVFSFFVDLGMQQLVIKKISEDKTHVAKYLGNYLSIQFGLGLFFMVVMDVIVYNAGYEPLIRHSLYIIALGLFLSSMTMPLMAVINGFQKLSIIARVNFFNSLVNAAMMLVAATFTKSIFFLAFIPVVVAGIDILIYSIIVHRKFTPFQFQFDRAFVKQMFIWNMPFMLLTIFSIYNRIDTLILPHLRNFTENGYYTAVYKFWDTLAFLPAVVAAALYPYFSDILSRGQKEEAAKTIATYTRYMIALAVPISVGAFILSRKLTVAFFGAEFAPAAPALWLLVLAVSVLMVYVPVNSMIISQRTHTATKVTGLTLLFNLGANFLLVPKFGFVMAAGITLVSEMIQLIGYTWVVQRKVVSFPYFKNFVKPVLAGGGMAAIVYLVQGLNLALVIALGAIVYSIGLFVLRFFQKEDWELLVASINFRQKVEPDNIRGGNL